MIYVDISVFKIPYITKLPILVKLLPWLRHISDFKGRFYSSRLPAFYVTLQSYIIRIPGMIKEIYASMNVRDVQM